MDGIYSTSHPIFLSEINLNETNIHQSMFSSQPNNRCFAKDRQLTTNLFWNGRLRVDYECLQESSPTQNLVSKPRSARGSESCCGWFAPASSPADVLVVGAGQIWISLASYCTLSKHLLRFPKHLFLALRWRSCRHFSRGCTSFSRQARIIRQVLMATSLTN